MKITKIELQSALYQLVRERWRADFGEEMELHLHKWLVEYKNDVAFLYDVYGLFQAEQKECQDGIRNIRYLATERELYVSMAHNSYSFPLEAVQTALPLFVDAMQEYLPLGSVVRLKKEFLKESFPVDDIEAVRFVITQRFADIAGTFYAYGGMVYPFGTFGGQELLYFTPPLIESVVHVGYSDDAELAFVYQMKEELLFKKQMRSIGFLNHEALQQIQDTVSKGRGV